MIQRCFLILLSLTACLIFSSPAFSQRVSIKLDRGWRFRKADVAGAQQPGFPDGEWTLVNLPHTWNTLDGERGGAYYRGAAWYRLHLGSWRLRSHSRVFIRFGAASMVADVFVNGEHLGHHDGGFTAFVVDVTNQLSPEKDNVVAVRVSNAPDRRVAPLDADFTFFGGLYRDVNLIVTNAQHISLGDYGSDGVYASLVQLSEKGAALAVTTELVNEGVEDTSDELRLYLEAPDGTVVAQTHKRVELAPHSPTSETESLLVANPHLWDGRRDPFLYHLHAELWQTQNLEARAHLADSVTVPFGIRRFYVGPSKGFFLNGHPLELRGVNMHQDWQDKGWALSPADFRANVHILLGMGANAVRLCHYPHAPAEIAALDQAGVVAWSEIPLVNTIDPSPEFARVTKLQLTEMVKQLYNHPSIAFWGLFNEVKADPTGLVSELNALAHTLDPSRPTVAASDRPLEFPLHEVPDLIAFNKYDGWYYRTLEDFGPEMDAAHARFPLKPVGVSEYGAGANVAQHQDPPPWEDRPTDFHPEERQNLFHESYLAQMARRPYLFGHFIWNLFDFAAPGRHEGGQTGINDKGLVSYDRRVKKDAYFLYKAAWTTTPTVYITSRRFNIRLSPDVTLKVYSNLPELTAALNGLPLGEPSMRSGVIGVWQNLKLHAGENVIEVTGRRGQVVKEDHVRWRLKN